MAKLKRTIEISFIVIASGAVLAQIILILLGWMENRRIDKEIWRSARVSVKKTDPLFPPGLLIEYENTGKRTISKTHFRLVFDDRGQEVCRADRDYGEVKAGEKRSVYLKSAFPAGSSAGTKTFTSLTYRLLVFPNNKKPLPEIVGEIKLQ